MDHHEPQVTYKRLGLTRLEAVFVLGLLILLMVLLWPASQSHPGSSRTICRNRLKTIVFALYEYRQSNGVFPPAYTVDANGNPLHSWRTLVLPYVDQKELYESIDLSKPWDDPVNADAFNQIPDVYVCPLTKGHDKKTSSLGVSGTGTFFSEATPRKLEDVTDKYDETMILIEVPENQGVPWMAPLDADEKLTLSFDAKTKWPHPNIRFVAFVDGSVKSLPTTTTPEELRRMLTIAGGD